MTCVSGTGRTSTHRGNQHITAVGWASFSDLNSINNGVTELLSLAAKYAAVFVFIANSPLHVNVLVSAHG